MTDKVEPNLGDEAAAGMGEERKGLSWDERQAARTEALIDRAVEEALGEGLGLAVAPADIDSVQRGSDDYDRVREIIEYRESLRAERTIGLLNDSSTDNPEAGIVVWYTDAALEIARYMEVNPTFVKQRGQVWYFDDDTTAVYYPSGGYREAKDGEVCVTKGSERLTRGVIGYDMGGGDDSALDDDAIYMEMAIEQDAEDICRIESSDGEMWQNPDIDPAELERPPWIAEL